ncbi:MAG: N-acetylmannosamine-6-phosphate 2-epimerase [Candidatus Fimenecus sp.]
MAHIKQNSLIISCQAVKGEPLYGYNIMHLMAKAAKEGGADAIRCNYVSDINSIKAETGLPTIGIMKAVYPDSNVYITPTLKEVKALLEETDTEVVALDATLRPRPNGEKLEDLVDYIRINKPSVEIMADISNMEEAKYADVLGFDYIGCTMRSYTESTKGIAIPDYDFIAEMVQSLHAKIIAEGGIWEANQLKKVWEANPYAVVIGSAVTRPKDITARFRKVTDSALKK